MSLPREYPDDVYTGSSGEASAWVRPSDTAADLTYRNGGTCEYVATGEQTGGHFGLYRWTFGEDESGPEPHFHRSITESFYVLSGEVRLYDGRSWVRGRAGDFLHVPEGGLHGFRGGGRSSMLLMFSPGAPREDYFETLARGEVMDAEERAAFMLRHDTFWV
jgi:quercetin dioxygenase-like cupin family protein